MIRNNRDRIIQIEEYLRKRRIQVLKRHILSHQLLAVLMLVPQFGELLDRGLDAVAAESKVTFHIPTEQGESGDVLPQ